MQHNKTITRKHSENKKDKHSSPKINKESIRHDCQLGPRAYNKSTLNNIRKSCDGIKQKRSLDTAKRNGDRNDRPRSKWGNESEGATRGQMSG